MMNGKEQTIEPTTSTDPGWTFHPRRHSAGRGVLHGRRHSNDPVPRWGIPCLVREPDGVEHGEEVNDAWPRPILGESFRTGNPCLRTMVFLAEPAIVRNATCDSAL